jgi:hypothetical protein
VIPVPINLSGFPYLDRTEEEKEKGYILHVGVPGRYLQARELTQIGRLLQLQLRDLGTAIFKQGAIIEGCQLTVAENTATITAGKIYYNGLILPVPETSLTITRNGTEIIGVNITESLVTEEEDPSLRDPYPAGRSFNRPGMHRVKITTQVVLDPNPQLKLYELKDGVPQITRTPTEFSEIINLLARRTYDESENYLVNGLEVSHFPRDDGKADILISPGKAYVLGYEVELPSPRVITVDPSTAYRTITDEMYLYNATQTTYKLYHQPVRLVERVMANVLVENYSLYRSPSPGGFDTIPPEFTNVLNIIEVRQGQKVYVRGQDYNIVNQNIIDWSPPGDEPQPNTAYTVTFIYHKVLVPNTDYSVTTDSDGNTIINFLPTRDNIVNNSYFEVDYQYFLGRIDILGLDSKGNTIFITGDSEEPELVRKPVVPYNILPLAEIYFPPYSNQLRIKNYNLKRVTMYQLNELLERFKQLEYNLLVTQLDDPAIRGASPADIVGMFSEGFIGFDRASMDHPAWSGIIVPQQRIFVPDYETITPVTFTVSSSDATLAGDRYMLPYTHKVYFDQPQASGKIQVNKYSVFTRVPIITVDPPFHMFYEKVIVKESERTHITTVHHTVTTSSRWHAGTTTKDTVTATWFEDKLLSKEAMTYIPQCTLNVYGTNFFPNQDNLAVYFDGVKLIATPTNNTPSGTEPGTVKSKPDGTLSLQFTIPTNRFYAGQKKIEVKNQYGGAETTFFAHGIRELYEKIKHINIRRDTTHHIFVPVDPLAQSFYIPDNCYLTGVGLFFAQKDNSIPITVQLRPMVNGFPGTTVLATKVVHPSQITTSQNATAETVVYFDSPVYVEGNNMYCITLTTDSNNYQVFYAEMGETDITTGAPITRQPYAFGNLFSSSDAFTWTAHQTSDLKFKIYRANFNTTTRTITTNSIQTTFLSFIPYFEYFVPDGTTIKLYYSLNDGASWVPMGNQTAHELKAVASRIQYRIVLQSNSNLLSPSIHRNMEGVCFLPKTTATYISNQVTYQKGFRNVELWIDVYRPTQVCNATVSYSLDNGNTWTQMTYNTNEVTAPALNWERRKYTANLGTSKTKIVFRVDLTTTNVSQQPACSNLIAILR